VVSCGRIGFDLSPQPIGGDGGGTSDQAMAGQLTWVRPFVGMSHPNFQQVQLGAQAFTAGDAVVLVVTCDNIATAPTAVTVTAPGWTFTQLAPIYGNATYGSTFAAIAPDTAPTTVTVSWTAAQQCGNGTVLGDEFTNNDPTGGTVTFDAHNETFTNGDCLGTVTAGHANDMVWAACAGTGMVLGIPADYIRGADDGTGDECVHKLTTDPASTVESVMLNANGATAMSLVTIKGS
jgi:hypothetical protein